MKTEVQTLLWLCELLLILRETGENPGKKWVRKKSLLKDVESIPLVTFEKAGMQGNGAAFRTLRETEN